MNDKVLRRLAPHSEVNLLVEENFTLTYNMYTSTFKVFPTEGFHKNAIVLSDTFIISGGLILAAVIVVFIAWFAQKMYRGSVIQGQRYRVHRLTDGSFIRPLPNIGDSQLHSETFDSFVSSEGLTPGLAPTTKEDSNSKNVASENTNNYSPETKRKSVTEINVPRNRDTKIKNSQISDTFQNFCNFNNTSYNKNGEYVTINLEEWSNSISDCLVKKESEVANKHFECLEDVIVIDKNELKQYQSKLISKEKKMLPNESNLHSERTNSFSASRIATPKSAEFCEVHKLSKEIPITYKRLNKNSFSDFNAWQKKCTLSESNVIPPVNSSAKVSNSSIIEAKLLINQGLKKSEYFIKPSLEQSLPIIRTFNETSFNRFSSNKEKNSSVFDTNNSQSLHLSANEIVKENEIKDISQDGPALFDCQLSSMKN